MVVVDWVGAVIWAVFRICSSPVVGASESAWQAESVVREVYDAGTYIGFGHRTSRNCHATLPSNAQCRLTIPLLALPILAAEMCANRSSMQTTLTMKKCPKRKLYVGVSIVLSRIQDPYCKNTRLSISNLAQDTPG